MSGFVLYDTQAIMEKRRQGSRDCVKHSLDLFFDLATMFRRLLIILTQKVSLFSNYIYEKLRVGTEESVRSLCL